MLKHRENYRSKVREDGTVREKNSFSLPSYVQSLEACELTDKIQMKKRKRLFIWELTKEVTP